MKIKKPILINNEIMKITYKNTLENKDKINVVISRSNLDIKVRPWTNLIFLLFFIFCFLGVFQKAEAVIVTPGVGFGSTTSSLYNGLVGWWTFDNQDMLNGAVRDKSGNGNTGNLVNIATSTFYTQGKLGQAFKFDGVNDYVQINNGANALSGLNNTALSVWFNGTANGFPAVVNSAVSDLTWGIEFNNSGTSLFLWRGGSYRTYTISINLLDKKWHHVVVNYTGSGDSASLYVDGQLQSSFTGSIAGMRTETGNIEIGRYRTGINYFKGSIDDVRIYNRALSASEISQLYKQGQAIVGATQNPKSTVSSLDSGLVGYWTFNNQDMLNGAVKDKSGNGNTGNLVNIATSTFYTRGKLGQGFKFDGANDYMTTASTFTPTTTFTVSAWVYPIRYGIVSFRAAFATRTYDSTDNFGVWLRDNGLYYIQVHGNGTDVAANTVAYSDKKWDHIILVKNTSSPYVKFYVNGVLRYSSTSNPDTLTSRQLDVGSYSNTTGPFLGTIDDVRIYNRALSDFEVTQLYKQGQVTIGATQNPKPTINSLDSGLVGYWTFNNQDMLNGAVKDKSGNGNTGSLINIATSTFYTQGKLGQGFKFDGADDYVNLGSAAILTAGSPFSISWWEKINSNTNNFPSRFNLKMNGTSNYFAVARAKSSASYQTITWGRAPNTNLGIRSSAAPSVASSVKIWRHFVITGSDPNSTTPGDYSIYADGVSYATIQAGTFSTDTRNSIGKSGVDNGADAVIDDVRVYNRALSATEIRQLYNQGR